MSMEEVKVYMEEVDSKLLLQCLLWTSVTAMTILVLVWLWLDILKKNFGSLAKSPPVCKNQTCDELNEKMTRLTKKMLSYENYEKEEKDVVDHMQKMIKEVHCADCVELNGPRCQSCQESKFSSQLKQEFFQCLRTTLVLFPEDLKGRRRAKRAAYLAKAYVFKYVPKWNVWIVKILFNVLFGQRWFKFLMIGYFALWNMVAYWIDRYGDLWIIHSIFVQDTYDFSLNTTAVTDCGITTQSKLDDTLTKINDIYASIGKSLLSMLGFIILYNILGTLENLERKKDHESNMRYYLKVLSVTVFFPFIMFYQIWKSLHKLEDPKSEKFKKFDSMTEDDFIEITSLKNRRRERITDAFNGSKLMFMAMLTNYLGFSCVVVQTEDWSNAHCLIENVTTDISYILTTKDE